MKKGIMGVIFLVLVYSGISLSVEVGPKKTCKDVNCPGENYCTSEIDTKITCDLVFCKDGSWIECKNPNS